MQQESILVAEDTLTAVPRSPHQRETAAAGPGSAPTFLTFSRELLERTSAALEQETPSLQHGAVQSCLNEIADKTTDLIAIADVAGHMIYCNPAGRRLLSIGESEDLTEKNLADLYPVWETSRILGDGVETALLDGSWTGETSLLARDGREVPVSQVIVAHLQGTEAYLSIVARDATASRHAEDVVRQSERYYRSIVQAANVGIWVIDAQNRTTFVNPKMSKMLGYSVDEMVGRPISRFVGRGQDAQTPGRAAASCDADDDKFELKLIRSDGKEIGVDLTTSPLFDEEECFAGTVGIAIEIAERGS